MATKKTETKKAAVTLTDAQIAMLKDIAAVTDCAGGIVFRIAARAKAAHKLATLGLVQAGHHETVKKLANGDARVTFSPAFRITKKGRAALAKAA